MKKSSLLVSLVAIMTVGAAHAAIPTSDWVQDKLDKKQNTLTAGTGIDQDSLDKDIVAIVDGTFASADDFDDLEAQVEQNTTNITQNTTDITNLKSGKQDKFEAGMGLSMDNGVLSAKLAEGANVTLSKGADNTITISAAGFEDSEDWTQLQQKITQIETKNESQDTAIGEAKGAADAAQQTASSKQDKLNSTNFLGTQGVSVSIAADGKITVSGDVASSEKFGVVKTGAVAEGNAGVVTGGQVAEAIAEAIEGVDLSEFVSQDDIDNTVKTEIEKLDNTLNVDAGKVISQIVQVDGKLTEVKTTTLNLANIDMSGISEGETGTWVLTYNGAGWALEKIDRVTSAAE